MATVPGTPLPYFSDGDTDLDNLNNLGYAAQFWTDNDVRPTWHFYKTNNMSLPATTWTTVNFGTVAFDSDGVYQAGPPGQVLIVTPGTYAIEGAVQVQVGTSGIGLLARFLLTAGANNPNETAGTTQGQAVRGGWSPTSGGDMAICISDLTRWVMYPGDTIALQVYPSVAVTLDNNNNSAFNAGRFVVNFTGQLVQSA